MGYVTKTVTEGVGGAAKTTSHMFEKLEDFLWWEMGQDYNQEEKVGCEVGRRYRVADNLTGHGFGIGEVVEVTSTEDGYIRASNGEKEYWMTEEDLEEV